VAWKSKIREFLEYQALDRGGVGLKPKIPDRLEKELNALIGTGANSGMVRNTIGGEEGGMPSKHYCADAFDKLADYLGYRNQARRTSLNCALKVMMTTIESIPNYAEVDHED
jgi:hypothetical protein